MTRSQLIALSLLGLLFLVALAILVLQVVTGGFHLDELPG